MRKAVVATICFLSLVIGLLIGMISVARNWANIREILVRAGIDTNSPRTLSPEIQKSSSDQTIPNKEVVVNPNSMALGVVPDRDYRLGSFDIETQRPIGSQVQGFISLSNIATPDGHLDKLKSPIPIQKDPDSNSALVMTMTTLKDTVFTQVFYEDYQPYVYAQKPDWFLVCSRNGLGWIHKKHVIKFTPIESVFSCTPTSFNQYWEKHLFSTPSYSADCVPIPTLPENQQPTELFVSCREFKWSQGSLWIKVNLNTSDPCGNPSIFKTDVIGWVPAFDSLGRCVISWYAQGC